MRLIDADALKATLIPFWNCLDDTTFANRVVWRELENAPTIDAVPVIRCKDCTKREYCRKSTVWAVAPNDDWYCADGEREEK